MDRSEFISRLQTIAGLSSEEVAERIVRVTLEVLRQWLTPEMAERLRSALPRELGDPLEGGREANQAGAGLQDFFERIAERLETDVPSIVLPVNATCEMIRECIDPRTEDELLHELPRDFARFLRPGLGADASTSEAGHTP